MRKMISGNDKSKLLKAVVIYSMWAILLQRRTMLSANRTKVNR